MVLINYSEGPWTWSPIRLRDQELTRWYPLKWSINFFMVLFFLWYFVLSFGILWEVWLLNAEHISVWKHSSVVPHAFALWQVKHQFLATIQQSATIHSKFFVDTCGAILKSWTILAYKRKIALWWDVMIWSKRPICHMLEHLLYYLSACRFIGLLPGTEWKCANWQAKMKM